VLVGRTREREAIAVALAAAEAGRGGLLLVAGEAGIGKTRLMMAAEEEARARGFAVAWGRAWELGGAPAFWPWVEALRELAPEGETAPQLGGGDDAERFCVFDDVAVALARWSRTRPLLILLDDLHASDESSLLLTELVARRLAGARVVVIGSHRDVEARANERVWASLMRLGRVGSVLRPPRLERQEVHELVRTLLGREAPEVATMVDETGGGNPLFVRELVQLVASGTGRLDVPEGVRAVLRGRLGAMSPAAVTLLSAAAIVGREFALTLVRETAGVSAARVDEAIDEACAAELVEPVAAGRYRFSHVLVAELLVRELPAEARARQYRSTAEALERLHGGDPQAPYDDIAEHYLHAGSGCAAQGVRAARKAGEQAMAQLAFEAAAAWFTRALEAQGIAAPGDTAARADLLLAQAEAHFRAGAREPGLAACATVADLARLQGSGELLARAALTLGGEVATGISDERLVAMLEEARATLPAEDAALRSRVLARLAGALQPAADPSGPVALAREAIAMARRLGDAANLLAVLHAANAALIDYAPADEQEELNTEAARLATATGARAQALRAYLRLAFARLQQADVDGFERAVEAHDRLAKEFRHPRYHWQTPLLRSMRPLWEGRFAEALRLEDEARALIARCHDDNGDRALLMRRVLALSTQLRDEGLDDACAALAAIAPFAWQRRVIGAWPHVRRGEAAEAAAIAGELDGGSWRAILGDPNFAAVYVEVAAAAGDQIRARELYQRWRPLAGQLVLASGMGFCVHDWVDRLLFVLADALDLAEEADGHAARARTLMARLGARPAAAELAASWGASLARRGEAAKARGLLDEARATAAELGMTLLARRLGAPVQRAPVLAAGPITARLEGELWTIEGCGELCRLKDSRGLQMLAQLLASPGRELHVLELSGAQQTDAGDAGETLDAEARQAYTTRLADLREEIEEARAWNDTGRRERLEHEVEALSAQLSAAVGLGGRARRTGSAVERARVNVQRRLTDALRRIGDAAPVLGRRLAATVRTGTFCVYQPIA